MEENIVMINGEQYFSGEILIKIEEQMNNVMVLFDEAEQLIQAINTQCSVDISVNIPYVSEEIGAMMPKLITSICDKSIIIDNISYLHAYYVHVIFDKLFEIVTDLQDTITQLKYVLRLYQKNNCSNRREQEPEDSSVKRVRKY